MCIRLSRSWDEPRAKKTNLDLNKYINLSAIKGNQEFASYTLLHMTCDLYYTFSRGPFSIPASLLNGPPWRNKMYLTLPYKSGNANKEIWLCDMSCSNFLKINSLPRLLALLMSPFKMQTFKICLLLGSFVLHFLFPTFLKEKRRQMPTS